MTLNTVRQYIDSQGDSYTKKLMELVSIASVSTDAQTVRQGADFLQTLLTEIGFAAQIVETSGNPFVYGELPCPQAGAPTILFYGHYDVQPAGDETLWHSPPFAAQIRDGRIYGRGVGDNKGQHLAHLLAIEAYRKTGVALPVNVKVVLDGEEEIGSQGLTEYARQNPALFQADFVYTSDGGMVAGDTPTLMFGVRGVFNFDLTLRTATTDNHSGRAGGAIPNAAWEMVQLLAKMVADDGSVLIPGFNDTVKPAAASDWEMIEKLPYDPNAFGQAFGTGPLTIDKKTYYDRQMFKPVMNINGIHSGYGGSGCQNIIPAYCLAKMDVRLAYDQDPTEVLQQIQDFVNAHNPSVTVELIDDFMWPSRTPTSFPTAKIVEKSLETVYGTSVVNIPITGASLPDAIWTKLLGLPSLVVPYANADENNHAPNENLKIDLFHQGIHATAQVLWDLGQEQT